MFCTIYRSSKYRRVRSLRNHNHAVHPKQSKYTHRSPSFHLSFSPSLSLPLSLSPYHALFFRCSREPPSVSDERQRAGYPTASSRPPQNHPHPRTLLPLSGSRAATMSRRRVVQNWRAVSSRQT